MNDALAALEGEFAPLHPPVGRPSIPPEKQPRGILLRAFYSIRSERQPMERLKTDLFFLWFVELEIGDQVWNHAIFPKNATACWGRLRLQVPVRRSRSAHVETAVVR